MSFAKIMLIAKMKWALSTLLVFIAAIVGYTVPTWIMATFEGLWHTITTLYGMILNTRNELKSTPFYEMAFSFAETQLTEKCDNSSTLAPDNTYRGGGLLLSIQGRRNLWERPASLLPTQCGPQRRLFWRTLFLNDGTLTCSSNHSSYFYHILAKWT